MEIRSVIGAFGDGVKGGIGETHRAQARSGGLLIDQGHEGGPERGGGAGAAHAVLPRAVEDVALQAHAGNVGDVAENGGSLVGRHADPHLVTGDAVARISALKDPAGGLPARRFGHGHFRRPIGARSGHGQLIGAHLGLGDQAVVLQAGLSVRRVADKTPDPLGTAVPRGQEIGLPLGRELRQDGILRRAVGVGQRPSPGTADLPGVVVRGDAAEHVRGDVPHINHHLAQARRHGHGHFHVQGHFDFGEAVGGRAVDGGRGGFTVQVDVGDRHV